MRLPVNNVPNMTPLATFNCIQQEATFCGISECVVFPGFAFPEGLKRLRKKSHFQADVPKGVPPGLKPALLLLALCGG